MGVSFQFLKNRKSKNAKNSGSLTITKQSKFRAEDPSKESNLVRLLGMVSVRNVLELRILTRPRGILLWHWL